MSIESLKMDPPKRKSDDAQGWDNYEQERDAYITNTIMAQYNQICGKDPQGNPIEGAKVDPGMAIIFFVMVLGPVLASKKGDNIDKDSFKVQDLTDANAMINKLKEMFDQAKDNTNTNEQNRLTEDFKSMLSTIEGKLNSDKWLASLAEQYKQPLADIRQALSTGKTLSQIWADAGFHQEFQRWDFDYSVYNHRVAINTNVNINTDPVTGLQYASCIIPKEVWTAIQNEPDSKNPYLTTLRKYCTFNYD